MRVVAYVRVSSAHQAEAYGPDVQRAAITKWAKANGHKIVAWYTDVISGASELRNRVGWCEAAANAAGYDGHFTAGALAGRTVNVKTYGKREGLLDMKSSSPLDYYLVFTGPKAAAASSRGTLRPFCIDAVYLFDAHRLRIDLGERGIKFSEATSVRAVHWDEAEIYPRPNNPLLVVSDAQQRQLAMFRGDA
jgi:Resolvase, N terminal domain